MEMIRNIDSDEPKTIDLSNMPRIDGIEMLKQIGDCNNVTIDADIILRPLAEIPLFREVFD